MRIARLLSQAPLGLARRVGDAPLAAWRSCVSGPLPRRRGQAGTPIHHHYKASRSSPRFNAGAGSFQWRHIRVNHDMNSVMGWTRVRHRWKSLLAHRIGGGRRSARGMDLRAFSPTMPTLPTLRSPRPRPPSSQAMPLALSDSSAIRRQMRARAQPNDDRSSDSQPTPSPDPELPVQRPPMSLRHGQEKRA